MTNATGSDIRAFTRLYEEHLGRLHAYCLRRLSPADAQDATAEVFTTVWRRWADRPVEAELLPWIYGIARKVVANGNRSSRHRHRLTTKLVGISPLAETGPEAIIVLGSEHEQVLHALSKLSETDQETVRLVEWEGLSRDEVAEVFGVSRAAIDQRMSRAYRRLERLLEGHPPPLDREAGRRSVASLRGVRR